MICLAEDVNRYDVILAIREKKFKLDNSNYDLEINYKYKIGKLEKKAGIDYNNNAEKICRE